MVALERACASAAHWSEDQYRAALTTDDSGHPERLVLVIEAGSVPRTAAPPEPSARLLAFLVAHQVSREWELENVVVGSAARRQGLGRRLLEELMAQARQSRGEAVFLEVRESNEPARALYRKLGFGEVGRRKAYYADPPEDAILCRLVIS
jgi:ribosomal-protein-alanine acetyltransferase